jgi:hypothetical protein
MLVWNVYMLFALLALSLWTFLFFRLVVVAKNALAQPQPTG